MLSRFLLGCLLVSSAGLLAQTPSPHLHVDQFGYFPLSEKVAVISNPQTGQNANRSFTPGTTMEVRDAQTSAAAWSGRPVIWNGGATHATSGDKGWWLDFSDLTTEGNYYVIDPASGERSATFRIGQNVYDSVLADAGRAFFYNRCNAAKPAPFAETGWTDGMNFTNPLQDTECSYLNDRENTNLRRDLSGGWFDAGDYNKYVTFAQTAVPALLSAYQESPSVFSDNWNLPESGNGIPDILDEVKWEIDWLRKMVNEDGSTILKMGSIDHADNVAAPPSLNTDRRYYSPTCTSASIAAADMLAHAALVFRDVAPWQAYAREIEVQSEAAFAYWVAASSAGNLQTNCDDGTIKAGDADREVQEQKENALTAAIHLFELTGKSVYNDYVRDNLADAEYIGSGWWGPYKNEFTTAALRYTTLAGAHPTTVTEIISSITPIVSEEWSGFFGFNTDDLYRAYMPDWSYHWGSNNIASRYANLNRMAARHNLAPDRNATLERKADHMIHYLHGVNPLGLVYLSGMEGRGADRGIQEIYHTWFGDGTDWDNSTTSRYGPAPGFVTGGPNKDFSVGEITPPAGEPPLKSYKDWNTSWPQNSWEITEPAIYYQAAYIRNLAALMTRDLSVPTTYHSPLSARPQAKTVLLEWRVETEEAASHYTVEYLNDQDEWQKLGRVNATGATRYRFVHEQPRAGNNEYRLQQVDLNGQSSYSGTAKAFFANRYANIKAFPNPSPQGTDLTLTGMPVGAVLRMYDAAGRRLFQQLLRQPRIKLPTAKLSTGWYHLELSQGREGVVWQEKFIIE